MPDQLQLRGGTTAQHETFTGASKEVTIDTTKKTAVVHDASTAGGNPLMREDGANSALINGSAAEPALAFAAGDADNGIYSPGADQVAISTNGTERVEWGASEVVFNDGGADYDFRIEGDTNANVLFVDASTDSVGVGTASPSAFLHVKHDTVANTFAFIENTTGGNAGVHIKNSDGNWQLIANANLRFRDQGNTTDRMVIDSSGRLLVGTATTSEIATAVFQGNSSSSTSAASIHLQRGAEPTGTQDFGSINFADNDGDTGAWIIGERDNGTWTAGSSHPGALAFGTTADGDASPTQRMRITSAGNVGIGTGSPGTILDIRQTQTGGETKISVFNTDTADTTTQTASIGLSPDSRASAIAGIEAIKVNADFSTNTGRDVALALNTTLNNAKNQSVYISHAGNVGIGTSTLEGAKLQVSEASSGATASANSDTLFLENNGQAGITIGTPNNTIGQIRFADPENDTAGRIAYEHNNDAMAFTVNNSERARIDSSGRLLVGRTLSTSMRRFAQAVDPKAQIISAGDTWATGLSCINYSTNGYAPILSLGTSKTSNLGVHAQVISGQRMGVIAFSGSDGTEFEEGGRIEVSVDGTPGSNDMPGRMIFYTTPSGSNVPAERMRITSAGILYSSPTYNNTTSDSANVFVSASGQFYRSTSSIKYKTDVEELQDSYADAILSVRPVWYRSLTSDANPDFSYWGFIAEEVAAIDPRLVHWKTIEVTYDEKGSAVETPCDPEPEGVAYDRFVPHLLNLIKRQQQAIETLEAKVAALEAN